MRNPITHLREASEAAAKIAFLQRDLYILNTELQAIRHARRAGLAITGAIFLNIMLTLGLFWVTQMLHESGWSAGLLAGVSFGTFGALSAGCFVGAYWMGGSSS